MKLFNLFFTLSALAAVTFGCQSENVAPRNDQSQNLQASIEGLHRPSNVCGTSTFTNFVDASNNLMGSIEVLNTENQVFMLVDMNNGWLLQGAKIFVGNSIDLPKTGSGLIQVEEFPYQFIHSRSQDKSTFRVNLSALPACYSIGIYGQAVQLNMFGSVVNSRPMWANGSVVLNGKLFNYCNGVCAPLIPDGPAQVN